MKKFIIGLALAAATLLPLSNHVYAYPRYLYGNEALELTSAHMLYASYLDKSSVFGIYDKRNEYVLIAVNRFSAKFDNDMNLISTKGPFLTYYYYCWNPRKHHPGSINFYGRELNLPILVNKDNYYLSNNNGDQWYENTIYPTSEATRRPFQAFKLALDTFLKKNVD